MAAICPLMLSMSLPVMLSSRGTTSIMMSLSPVPPDWPAGCVMACPELPASARVSGLCWLPDGPVKMRAAAIAAAAAIPAATYISRDMTVRLCGFPLSALLYSSAESLCCTASHTRSGTSSFPFSIIERIFRSNCLSSLRIFSRCFYLVLQPCPCPAQLCPGCGLGYAEHPCNLLVRIPFYDIHVEDCPESRGH